MIRLALPAAVLVAGLSAIAQEWPRFRGPNGSGIGQVGIPAQWTQAKNCRGSGTARRRLPPAWKLQRQNLV